MKRCARKSTGGVCKSRKEESTIPDEPRSYSRPVLESHLGLLREGAFSDVTFIVGETKERIPCHKLFLKARSPVFNAMLSGPRNRRRKMVPLEDVNPGTFVKLLKFIYVDTLRAQDVSEALELLPLAKKFEVKLLVSECEKLLESKVTLVDTVRVFQAARTHRMTKLMEKIGDMWAKSLFKMQALPSFTQLDKETLVYILKRMDLKMKEVDLFRLALQWAENQKDVAVKDSLEDILPLIRFPTMTLNEFSTAVAPTKLLCPSAVVDLVTYFGTDNETQKSLLARTLEFSTQQRQPKDYSDYVTIYPQGSGNYTRYQEFQNLRECLQFHNSRQQYCWPTAAEDGTLDVGWSALTFYCPTKKNTKTEVSGRASTSFKSFKICLKSQDFRGRPYDYYCDQNYTELLNLSSVQVEEGKRTDVRFDTVIALKRRTPYCIEIEEIANGNGNVRLDGYNTQEFGPGPSETVSVRVEDHVRGTLDVMRNQLKGFGQAGSDPKLICRLGFEEL